MKAQKETLIERISRLRENLTKTREEEDTLNGKEHYREEHKHSGESDSTEKKETD
jgi:hypothetical protein